MYPVINECFMCTNNNKCNAVNQEIINEVEYLMPEITIIQLGIPLRICFNCEKNLHSFKKFKQICVENTQRLEERIKNNDHKYEEIYIKEEILEETATPETNDCTAEISIKEEPLQNSLYDDECCMLMQDQDTLKEENATQTQLSTNSADMEVDIPLSRIKEVNCVKNQNTTKEGKSATIMESECSNTPPELLEEVTSAHNNLLPSKSKSRYEKYYDLFLKWKKDKKVKDTSENVILAYISEMSKIKNAATLWCEFSMLKSVCKIKENTDIGTYKKVIAFLRQNSRGYVPRKSQTLSEDECLKFLSQAPDEEFLMMKVILIMGLYGACRGLEITNMTIDNMIDSGSFLTIVIPKTKNYENRKFTIPNSVNGGVNPTDIIKSYLALRPTEIPHRRFFIQYKKGECTRQPVGKNTISKIPCQIAKYLQLPNPTSYTGHCFKRSSATMFANSGIDILSLKRLGRRKSSNIAEDYAESSAFCKNQIANNIFKKNNLDMQTSASNSDTSNQSSFNDNDNQLLIERNNPFETTDTSSTTVFMHNNHVSNSPKVSTTVITYKNCKIINNYYK